MDSEILAGHLDNGSISCVKSPALLMKETPDRAGGRMFPKIRESGIDGRVFRSMILATVLVVVASLPFVPWRISTGLLLGGLLSLFNYHWLNSSTVAAFSVLAHGAKPRLKLAQYVLRYLVVGTVVFVAYKLNVVSLAATLVGLSSFVVALFVEALREFYFAFIHREETS
jgi:hypothetical protein